MQFTRRSAIIAAAIATTATAAQAGSSTSEAPAVVGVIIAACGVVLPLVANVFLAERARRHERQAVVTAFRSDVRSIVFVLDSLEIIDSFIGVLRLDEASFDASLWADAPRNEDYFQLYGNLAGKIGLTPAPLAREIVRFYTFLHASRDSATPLGALKEGKMPIEVVRIHARNVLLALSQSLDAAKSILDVEFSQSHQNDGQSVVNRLHAKVDAELNKFALKVRIPTDA